MQAGVLLLHNKVSAKVFPLNREEEIPVGKNKQKN